MTAVSASEPTKNDEREPNWVLGHLAATVVHQVINSFSTIVSQAEILKATAGDDEAQTAARADVIIRAALAGSTVARKLADYSRGLTAVGPDGAAERVDLNQLVADRVDAWRRRVGPNVEITAELAGRAEMLGIAQHLQTMLDCLIANGRESLPPEGGRVMVTTAVDDIGWLVLEVRDSGSGMSDEILQRALGPFFTTKPDRPGLGLALARGVWRSHRGAFSIESTPGRGTLVRLACPAWRPDSPRGGSA